MSLPSWLPLRCPLHCSGKSLCWGWSGRSSQSRGPVTAPSPSVSPWPCGNAPPSPGPQPSCLQHPNSGTCSPIKAAPPRPLPAPVCPGSGSRVGQQGHVPSAEALREVGARGGVGLSAGVGGVCPLNRRPAQREVQGRMGQVVTSCPRRSGQCPAALRTGPRDGAGLGGLWGWRSPGAVLWGAWNQGPDGGGSGCPATSRRAGTVQPQGQGPPNPAAGGYRLGLPPSAAGNLRPRARKPPGHRPRPAAIWGRVSRAAFPSVGQCDVTTTDGKGGRPRCLLPGAVQGPHSGQPRVWGE